MFTQEGVVDPAGAYLGLLAFSNGLKMVIDD
jgi:hypothetical protein